MSCTVLVFPPLGCKLRAGRKAPWCRQTGHHQCFSLPPVAAPPANLHEIVLLLLFTVLFLPVVLCPLLSQVYANVSLSPTPLCCPFCMSCSAWSCFPLTCASSVPWAHLCIMEGVINISLRKPHLRCVLLRELARSTAPRPAFPVHKRLF